MSDLPPGWEWAALGDIAESVKNGIYISRPGAMPDGVPILRINAVRPAELRLDEIRYSGKGIKNLQSEGALLEPGDLLFTRYSGSRDYVGVCAITPDNVDPLTYPDKLIRVRLKEVVPKYAMFAFSSPSVRSVVESSLCTTAGQVGISGANLKAVRIPLAPLAEQRRIVAVLDDRLSRVDASESILRTVTERIEQMRDQYIAAACTGSLALTAGLSASHPTYVGVQDGELPPLPGNWKWARLAEIADVVGGITKDTKKQTGVDLPEVPYLRVANVQRGRLNLDSVTLIRVPIDKVRQLRLQTGDVLLNEGGDRDKLGRGWIWEGQIPECIHQNHVFRARIRDNQLDPKLLAWHANTFGKGWCERNGKQSVNLASISLSKIRLLPVPVPPRKDQAALVALIEEHLAELDRLGEALHRALRRSEYLRRSLLAEAFAGRLVQQDPNDEPASVLLERIKAERVTRPRTVRARRTAKNVNPEQESML